MSVSLIDNKFDYDPYSRTYNIVIENDTFDTYGTFANGDYYDCKSSTVNIVSATETSWTVPAKSYDSYLYLTGTTGNVKYRNYDLDLRGQGGPMFGTSKMYCFVPANYTGVITIYDINDDEINCTINRYPL